MSNIEIEEAYNKNGELVYKKINGIKQPLTPLETKMSRVAIMENNEDEDSESEYWKKHAELSRQKRWSNDKWSIDFLTRNGVNVQVLNKNISHYRIGDYDFWATTGKFINRKTKKSGRGIKQLYKLIKHL